MILNLCDLMIFS